MLEDICETIGSPHSALLKVGVLREERGRGTTEDLFISVVGDII